jgi:hypothetical protein
MGEHIFVKLSTASAPYERSYSKVCNSPLSLLSHCPQVLLFYPDGKRSSSEGHIDAHGGGQLIQAAPQPAPAAGQIGEGMAGEGHAAVVPMAGGAPVVAAAAVPAGAPFVHHQVVDPRIAALPRQPGQRRDTTVSEMMKCHGKYSKKSTDQYAFLGCLFMPCSE